MIASWNWLGQEFYAKYPCLWRMGTGNDSGPQQSKELIISLKSKHIRCCMRCTQIMTFFKSIFAKTSWYFLTVCSSKAFLTSAFWGLTKRSTSGVVDALDTELLFSPLLELFPTLLVLLPLPMALEEFVPLLFCALSDFDLFSLFVLFWDPSFAAFVFCPLSVALTSRFFLEAPLTSLHRSSDVTFSLSMPRATRSNAVVVVCPEDWVAVVSRVVSGSGIVSEISPPPPSPGLLGGPLGRPIPWNPFDNEP